MDEDLKQEIKNLRMLLWAAAKGNGGKITIYDRDIHSFSSGATLKRLNDSANKCVIFIAH